MQPPACLWSPATCKHLFLPLSVPCACVRIALVVQLKPMTFSRCNHGGHNGCLDDWFEGHDTCGTHGCICKCTSHDLPMVS